MTEEKSAFDFCFELLKKIAGKGAKPVAYAIRTVNNALSTDFEEAVAEEFRLFRELMLEGNEEV